MSRRSASGTLEATTEILPWQARIFHYFIRHAKCYLVLLQGDVSLKFLILEFYVLAALRNHKIQVVEFMYNNLRALKLRNFGRDAEFSLTYGRM